MAMTSSSTRRVHPHTPLVGLPGRLGTSARPGSHPGPLSFYLLAPVYRLLGQTHGRWSSAAPDPVRRHRRALWIGYRRGSRRGVGVGTGMVVAVHMFGQVSLTHRGTRTCPCSRGCRAPRHLVVFCGDTWMAVPLVARRAIAPRGTSRTPRSRSGLQRGPGVRRRGQLAPRRRGAVSAWCSGARCCSTSGARSGQHARWSITSRTARSRPGVGRRVALALEHFDVVAVFRGDLAALAPPGPAWWRGTLM